MAFVSKSVKNVTQLRALQQALRDAGKLRARVGVLAGEKTTRHDIDKESQDKIDNPTLGLEHELGSIKRNIPPRSWLVMPLRLKLREKIDQLGAPAWRELILQKGMTQALKELGVLGEAAVQEGFNTGGFGRWPQWSRRYARRRELLNRHKTNRMTFVGPVKPGSLLIMSAQLRKSVTSDVKVVR